MFLSCHVCISEWIHSYSCLNMKELLAWSRHVIWSLSGCNWTWTQNHLVCKWTLNLLAKLTKWVWIWTIEGGFTLKGVCGMIRTYSQYHCTDKHSEHSSIKRKISPGIFSFFRFFTMVFGVIGGCRKAKKWPKMTKSSVCLTPYLRNPTLYDYDFWYTCVKWLYLQQIFSFFKILIFRVFRGEGKSKKWPNFNMFSSISQELLIISSRFW